MLYGANLVCAIEGGPQLHLATFLPAWTCRSGLKPLRRSALHNKGVPTIPTTASRPSPSALVKGPAPTPPELSAEDSEALRAEIGECLNAHVSDTEKLLWLSQIAYDRSEAAGGPDNVPLDCLELPYNCAVELVSQRGGFERNWSTERLLDDKPQVDVAAEGPLKRAASLRT